MPSRHRSRQRALQVLYQWDVGRQPVPEAIRLYYETLYTAEEEAAEARLEPDSFMEELVRGAAAKVDDIDHRIARHSEHWRLDRMPAVDRNILRLAVCEMLLHATPVPVVIDEAIELARRFSGEESVPFINGVLDAVRKDLGTSAAQGA